MPLKTWDRKEDFDAAYSLRRRDAQGRRLEEVNYNRCGLYDLYVVPEIERLIAHFQWPLEVSILIVGCGFGWSIEAMQERGYRKIWGTDNSPWIQSEKGKIDPFDGIVCSQRGERVLPHDLSQQGQHHAVLTACGVPSFDVIITERVLTSLTDQECILLGAIMRTMLSPGGQIIHIETPRNPPNYPKQGEGYNWKSTVEWKAMFPDDVIAESGGMEFL